jgi:ribosome biogenesis GTPase
MNQNESSFVSTKCIGWDDYYENGFKPYRQQGYCHGRIFVEHRNIYGIYTEFGEMSGEITGKLRYNAEGGGDYPAVGDWVAISIIPGESRAIIHAVLPRKSRFSRKAAGVETREQVVAANFDTVFVVSSLNREFNLRRMERYLTMAWESGAQPVVVLSKADLCENAEKQVSLARSAAIGICVHAVSSVTGQGIEELSEYIVPGRTVAVLGSSGVGKSSLINCLAGLELLETGDIREGDDRGRHTTTHRQLLQLPGGGLIIDTPGMRELQLWDGEEGLKDTFEDIERLSHSCRFSDCRHMQEPGCAVKNAIDGGILDRERFESYMKLEKEMRYLESKQNQLAHIRQKKEAKSLSKKYRRG